MVLNNQAQTWVAKKRTQQKWWTVLHKKWVGCCDQKVLGNIIPNSSQLVMTYHFKTIKEDMCNDCVSWCYQAMKHKLEQKQTQQKWGTVLHRKWFGFCNQKVLGNITPNSSQLVMTYHFKTTKEDKCNDCVSWWY